jgi:DNA-binding transcriptional ArsR family regulator
MTARPQVKVVDAPDALQALGHPTRLKMLDALREPASAAATARAVGQSRQNANYHLKELERAGLVTRVGERRNGNFVETLYQSTAGTVVVSPRAAWSDPRRLQALADQVSLENLVVLGEHLSGDAVALLDRAAFDGEEIASAAVEAQAAFPDEATREAFLGEYVAALSRLLTRYGSSSGHRYRVVLAAYPDPDDPGPEQVVGADVVDDGGATSRAQGRMP